MSTIRFLRTFLAVAHHGSFSEAAEQVALTQAAVSVHIRQLEEELGAPLFLRVNKKLHLTETGRALLAHSASQARGHREVVARFGRQPHRNAVLGRTSTREELEYLTRGDFVHQRQPPSRLV